MPGYKLVDSFGPDSEYVTRGTVNPEGNRDGGEGVEEEVEYVTLEISGIADVDPNLLTSYRLIVSPSSRKQTRSSTLSDPSGDLHD